MEKRKHRFGDRKDARWVREATGMQVIMGHLMPRRTESEVYLHDTFDATPLLEYIEKKNAQHPEYKTTMFHCLVAAVARMCRERPVMNRYVQSRRLYERDNISISFTCKRRFADAAEESIMTVVAKDEDTLDTISRRIVGDVTEMRRSEHSTGGIDAVLDKFARIPRLILIPVVGFVRILDFWGKVPKALKDGDPNYSTVLCSNLGSIKCPAIYHHLNNYGTNSVLVTIGQYHKQELIMPDGSKEMRDVVDIGATLDERIGDGFYFARSLKLVKYIFAHPEILDKPLDEPSGYDYQ